jgi:two-component system sensor histidine kinase DegS
MNSASYDIILDLLSNLKIEFKELKSTIDHNNTRISEIENYISSCLNEEDLSYKVFSPRNVETVHKNEFESLRSEADSLQELNFNMYERLDILQSQINQLQTVLNFEKDSEKRIGNIDPHFKLNSFGIIKIQEKERRRIARDLHDSSLQNLAFTIQKLDLASLYIDQDPLRAKLELSVISKGIRDIIEDIRSTIFNLRPMTFDDLGLGSAFQRLLDNINEEKKYIIDVSIEDVSCENDLVLSTIYQVVQDCVMNIVKHSEADRILFHSKCLNDYYHITIEDNGKGFSESDINAKGNKHFGLSILKERAGLLGGTIDIQSQINKGTRINIDFPIKGILNHS